MSSPYSKGRKSLKSVRGVSLKLIKLLFHQFEKLVEVLWAGVRSLLGWRWPAVILPYTSYANEQKARLLGRVIEDYRPGEFVEGAGRFKHLVKVIKLFITYDIAGAKVRARFRGQEVDFESDSEGYFSCEVQLDEGTRAHAAPGSVTYDILATNHKSIPVVNTQYESEVIFPTNETDYLVVSDIDDTILKSHATSFLRLVANTLFLPLEKRKTFLNTVEFYQRLQSGKNGDRNNLFFYVSSSTWNMYPLLRAFIQNQKLPRGPMLLQNLSAGKDKVLTTGHEHKLHRIREIANLHSKLPIVLIGDAGQQDPYLYLEALKDYPDRVKAIFIRKLAWRPETTQFDELIKEAREFGVEMVFFDDPAELTEHIDRLPGERGTPARLQSELG